MAVTIEESGGPTRRIDRVLAPIRVFSAHKLAGAGLLLGAAVLALVWANSPWGPLYERLLHTRLGVSLDGLSLTKDIGHWISDGLMGIFFFLVGLEIKRELLTGELSSPRKAALPAVAAIGGMLAPALLYRLVNPNGPAAGGWGVPMSTDIAFALGVMALLGDRVPQGLKVFLTALAIVDDIGAVLVIAIFYTADLNSLSLVFGLVFFTISIFANQLEVHSPVAYFIIGACVWLSFLQSGVHATVAALLMAFTIPARTSLEFSHAAARLRVHLDDLGAPQAQPIPAAKQPNELQSQLIDAVEVWLENVQAPLRRLEHYLVGPVTFLVLPVFAMANAGVALGNLPDGALTHPVALGVVLGLVVGKPLGVTFFAWLAVKLKLADLPSGVSWSQVVGVGSLAGIGFTMALFIGKLAFADAELVELTRLGVLCASALSALLGLALLARRGARRGQPVPVGAGLS